MTKPNIDKHEQEPAALLQETPGRSGFHESLRRMAEEKSGAERIPCGEAC